MVPFCRLFRWSIPLSPPASPCTGGISNSVSWTKEVLWMEEGLEKSHRDCYLKQPFAAVCSQAAPLVVAMMTMTCY